jgi:rhodanese-related sulfurtransferase
MGFFGAADAGSGLPAIPDLDRPMSMELGTVKQFFDAGAATFLDARDEEEYRGGHIPGALPLSFEAIEEDPARLAELEPGGRPIIVYCGGGSCEVSIRVADALVAAGQRKVLVYTGGLPEWEAAGYPVARGSEPRRGGS